MTAELMEKMNEIKQETTILLVEQNYEMATAVGDYFYFVEDGKTVFECTKEVLLQDESVKQKYLGV